ncbi:MAG: hypothetical protein KAR73_13850, partial [Spirochaetales bacterium]|nr:hypothetical protein [Spirochaetales bacterium]
LNGWGTDLEFSPIPYDEFHAYIQDRFQQNGLTISYKNAQYLQDLVQLLENRESRYETYLGQFSATELKVLIALAKEQVVVHPQSKKFLSSTSLSARAIGQIINRLMDRGVLEKIAQGYRLSDPLLSAYLRYYR